jgi:muconolactone D-isomerase
MPSVLTEEENMEFLVEFEITVPPGTTEAELDRRERTEATAASALVEQGHLIRVWRLANGRGSVLGLYRAESAAELGGLLEALPLYEWMEVKVIPLEQHPNDPHVREATDVRDGSGE